MGVGEGREVSTVDISGISFGGNALRVGIRDLARVCEGRREPLDSWGHGRVKCGDRRQIRVWVEAGL